MVEVLRLELELFYFSGLNSEKCPFMTANVPSLFPKEKQ